MAVSWTFLCGCWAFKYNNNWILIVIWCEAWRECNTAPLSDRAPFAPLRPFLGLGWNGNSWGLRLCKGYCTSESQIPNQYNGVPLDLAQELLNIYSVWKSILKVKRWMVALTRRRSIVLRTTRHIFYLLFLFNTESDSWNLASCSLGYGGGGVRVTDLVLLRGLPSPLPFRSTCLWSPLSDNRRHVC